MSRGRVTERRKSLLFNERRGKKRRRFVVLALKKEERDEVKRLKKECIAMSRYSMDPRESCIGGAHTGALPRGQSDLCPFF